MVTLTTWCNGEQGGQVASDDRALLFGDSCFTTMAIRAGQPELWSRHRERLLATTEQLQFPPLDMVQLEREVAVACRDVERAVLRVTLSRGCGGRGYALPDSGQPQRHLLRRPWPVNVEQRARDGVQLRWCQAKLAHQPLLAGLKHGNRLEQILARAEWQAPQIAEGLMCDYHGHVIEGTTSNVFFRDARGNWCTPALTQCGVAGVMRAEILARLQQQGQSVLIQDFAPDAIGQCTEIFVCNAVAGIWPVIELNGQRWPIGTQTRWLQAALRRDTGE